jgi:NADP-dependent 3-hydroxy acid dehydrogenase YdfG
MKALSDKMAVVSGPGSGIGRATAIALAALGRLGGDL